MFFTNMKIYINLIITVSYNLYLDMQTPKKFAIQRNQHVPLNMLVLEDLQNRPKI